MIITNQILLTYELYCIYLFIFLTECINILSLYVYDSCVVVMIKHSTVLYIYTPQKVQYHPWLTHQG